MFVVLIWVLLVILVSVWANNWGHKASNYFWLSFFLSPVVGALVLRIKGKDDSSINQQRISSKEMKRCPYCRELIIYEATVCKFCGKTLEQSDSSSTTSYSSSSPNYSVQNNESHFYTFETLNTEQKTITNEYINRVLNCTDLGQVLEIQKPYFGTSSLGYIRGLLPDANDFKDYSSYKLKIEEGKARLNGEIIEEKTETYESEFKDKKDNKIENSMEHQLTELKALFDKGLIDENDYKAKKNQLLGL